MGKCILELLDLGFFIKVILFDFAIFVLYAQIQSCYFDKTPKKWNMRKCNSYKKVTYAIHRV